MPVLPGVVLIFAGTLIYGFFVHFQGGLNLYFYIGQGIALVLIFFLDYLAGIWGTRKYGGSSAAAWGSVIGAVLGIFTLGPLGIIVGPFIGAVAADFVKRGNLKAATRAGVGTIVGFLGGTAVKFIIEIVMIIWFFTVIF